MYLKFIIIYIFFIVFLHLFKRKIFLRNAKQTVFLSFSELVANEGRLATGIQDVNKIYFFCRF